GIVLGGRLLLRPVLRWIARSRTAEIFTAAALLLVVGIAYLMLGVGLSMALGAFLAGVLLAESEYRRELEADIEPFKGLLLGLFFIAVGMSIDFGVLWRAPGTMALIVLGFLATKLAVIHALAAAMRLPGPERPVFTLLLAQGGEFAFVVFQAAVGARVLATDTASLLTGAVALSMLLSPLLLALADRWWLPRFNRASTAPAEAAAIPEQAPIIIAGFGRYGQIVGRALFAQGLQCTVLEHDADMIEAIRPLGFRVFYGDASRLDVLRVAGAAQARVLVLAVDDMAQSLRIAALVREHFPQLEIVARARDVPHWNALRDLGVQRVERELFESSLRSARGVLEVLGVPAHEARHGVLRFRDHNLALFERMHPHHRDRARSLAAAREGRRELEEQLAREREERSQRRPPGWRP
ncbi:MAG TPA: cation:proton antiporter, partial [Pseudorhodoferax sp.]|nr:cation:proton antiporter [Pseudorhodoferax sp.]